MGGAAVLADDFSHIRLCNPKFINNGRLPKDLGHLDFLWIIHQMFDDVLDEFFHQRTPSLCGLNGDIWQHFSVRALLETVSRVKTFVIYLFTVK